MAGVRLRVIVGPTAAGKSAIALALAERFGGALISADSRQIYRHFDVGTAKPTRDEQRRVPHYGVDVIEPEARYSAALWSASATGWLAAARERRQTPLVVGGTGFYLRALFTPLFEAPPLDVQLRAGLERVLAGLSLDELRRWCLALDPNGAHLGRTQLLRSIETALLSGERLSTLHRERARAVAHAPRYLLVDPGPSLARRIAARIDSILEPWLDEVRGLEAHVSPDAPAWTATGYDRLRDVVRGERTLEQARDDIVIATRQYAKRQRTWLRHQLGEAPVTTLDPTAADAAERAAAWWMEDAR